MAQLLQPALVDRLAQARQERPGHRPHQGPQRCRRRHGQQGGPEVGVLHGGLQQGQAHAGGQGRIGPVFEQ